MDRTEYLKNYKHYHYGRTRKIVTFPLLTDDFETLKNRADALDMKVSKLVKDVVLNFIENTPNRFMTQEQLELVQNYIRVSRGIANNINQIAYKANIGEYIDINILISALKKYEDEFRLLIAKLQ